MDSRKRIDDKSIPESSKPKAPRTREHSPPIQRVLPYAGNAPNVPPVPTAATAAVLRFPAQIPRLAAGQHPRPQARVQPMPLPQLCHECLQLFSDLRAHNCNLADVGEDRFAAMQLLHQCPECLAWTGDLTLHSCVITQQEWSMSPHERSSSEDEAPPPPPPNSPRCG